MSSVRRVSTPAPRLHPQTPTHGHAPDGVHETPPAQAERRDAFDPRPSRPRDAEGLRRGFGGETRDGTAGSELAWVLDRLRRAPNVGRTTATLARRAARLCRSLDGNWRRASVFLAHAQSAAPADLRTQRLTLRFLSETQQRSRALALAESLLVRQPDHLATLLEKIRLLIDDARAPEALAACAPLRRLLEAPGLSSKLRHAARVQHGLAAYGAGKPNVAIALYKEVLAEDPEHIGAHNGIAELVVPTFSAPHRAEVEALCDAGGRALLRGDAQTARQKAVAALRLEPDEGLAHKLFVWAAQSEARQKREAKAGGPRVLEAVADAPSRRAVLAHVEKLIGKADIGEPRRKARPEDVFPEWHDLNEVQRATVAFSVFGYGGILPTLIEEGLVCHLVLPGRSALAVDGMARRNERNPFGRYWHAIRGWHREDPQRGSVIVVGAEVIDDIARGAYNTITHELAHAVHSHIRKVARRKVSLAGTPHAELLGPLSAEIETLYRQAKRGRDGQRLLDNYSGNDSWEYLAQGWMAYLNPVSDGPTNNPRRLFSRNPELFALCRRLTQNLADYPARFGMPAPAAAGESQEPTPWKVWQLRDSATGKRRKVATQVLAELLGLYLAAPAELTPANRRREAEILTHLESRRRRARA